MGRTVVHGDLQPLATIARRGANAAAEPDGCQSAEGRVWGCYIHGIFANQTFRRGWLRALGWHGQDTNQPGDPYQRLADHVAANLDSERLDELLSVKGH